MTCEYKGTPRTCSVTFMGVTTEYVYKDDHDRAIRDAQMKIANLELALERASVPPGYVRVPCNCVVKHSYHVMAIEPDVPFVPVSSLKCKCKCRCAGRSPRTMLYPCCP